MFLVLFWQTLFRVSNAALSSMLCLLKFFMRLLGTALHCRSLVDLAELIPRTLQGAYKCIGLAVDDFTEYVVCPDCHSIYEFKDCFEKEAGVKVSKKCCHISYPNHPQRSRRKKCGAQLLKKVNTGRGYKLVPNKVYPYYSLQKSLQRLVGRQGFLSLCEQWRERARSVPASYLGDIYDGRVWTEFNSPSFYNFLAVPFSYLLTLNVDWFQPFSHTEYSVGAIYLTIQNLPRSERFKEENVILVGVIPGPSEPNLVINSYLSPLIEELKLGWYNGFAVMTPDHVAINVRVALSCVACDIPASRKAIGFLGHHANLACNKCMKKFTVSFGTPTNYSGFKRNEWVPRTALLHRQHCEEILQETTRAGVKRLESQHGVRYSILLSLPYFDPIRFTAIDPMHNLLLGTGKHCFKVWVAKGILTDTSLTEIDRRARLIKVPSEVGRLPINISSNYGGFKADQWRAWITVYSPVVLKGILPPSHFLCWMVFVRACCILCQRILRKVDLVTADLLLLNFFEKFQGLYGEDSCTMNLHLHLHLKEVYLDFGPSHAFWCYPFERYNGILGSFPTNNKAVEIQFMRKFINSQSVQSVRCLADQQLLSLFPPVSADSQVCTLSSLVSDQVNIESLLTMSSSPLTSFRSIPTFATQLSPIHEIVFPSDTITLLRQLYSQLYPHFEVTYLSPFSKKCGRVNIGGDIFGSVLSGASARTSSVIMAFWPGTGNDLSTIDYLRMRVGIIQYYFNHSFELRNRQTSAILKSEQVFACTYWKQRHPQEEWFGMSSTVCLNVFEPVSMCSFMPVERIANKCAHCVADIDFDGTKQTVFVAISLPVKFCL